MVLTVVVMLSQRRLSLARVGGGDDDIKIDVVASRACISLGLDVWAARYAYTEFSRASIVRPA